MSAALVRVYPGRPTWVTCDEWLVCVSVRDAAYYRERAAWKRRLLFWRQHERSRRIAFRVERYQQWKRRHRREYLQLGLTPPDGSYDCPFLKVK